MSAAMYKLSIPTIITPGFKTMRVLLGDIEGTSEPKVDSKMHVIMKVGHV